MKALSFDIGIKNLAYCLLDKDEIYEWDIINVSAKTINEISSLLLKKLNEIFSQSEFDIVLIENQPVIKNPTMKSIQMIIYTYFKYLKDIEKKEINDVLLVSANNKNKFMDKYNIDIGKCSSKYVANKKKSIECTKLLIKNESLDFFLKHSKKDDLADCYLQGLDYLKKIN
jgi:hypothetical protein